MELLEPREAEEAGEAQEAQEAQEAKEAEEAEDVEDGGRRESFARKWRLKRGNFALICGLLSPKLAYLLAVLKVAGHVPACARREGCLTLAD